MSSPKPLAIIYGVGPLLGLSLAKAFAPSHSLAIISRTLSHLTPLVQTLEKEVEGVEVRAFEADTDRGSLERAFGKIREEFRERRVDVGIWNAGGRFSMGPFLEQTEEQFKEYHEANVLGPVHFSQLILPSLLSNPSPSPTNAPAKGSLLFTGATASLKGSANFSAFSTGKFGLRALSQSLAREFGPQGVHVAHVIIDGMIWRHDEREAADALNPGSIAKAYLYLSQQDRTAFTHELDLRPGSEKF